MDARSNTYITVVHIHTPGLHYSTLCIAGPLMYFA